MRRSFNPQQVAFILAMSYHIIPRDTIAGICSEAERIMLKPLSEDDIHNVIGLSEEGYRGGDIMRHREALLHK